MKFIFYQNSTKKSLLVKNRGSGLVDAGGWSCCVIEGNILPLPTLLINCDDDEEVYMCSAADAGDGVAGRGGA